MEIKQFRYNADNLGYLAYSDGEGVAIDGGAVAEIVEFAEKNRIAIRYVTNTHCHHDHISGNNGLLEKTGGEFLDCKTIKSDQTLVVGKEKMVLFPTPGHTMDSITFASNGFLVTGDTLFNGTVGNCFTGDLKSFYDSLIRLMAYPEKTAVYAGHDYVAESMKYASLIEPYNQAAIDAFSEQYSHNLVVSTLADEVKVNPYIRFNAPEMIDNLKKRDAYSASAYDRFETIMELY